jgi:hypothetical protein
MMKRKTILRIKVRDTGEMIEYEAIAKRSSGEVLKISGSTCCETKSCVTQILKRALSGKRDTPEYIEKAVTHVVDYLLTSIKSFRSDNVSARLWLNVDIEAELRISASLYYLDGGEVEDEEEYIGWVAEMSAAFSGCDGAAIDGFHEFKKELALGRRLDETVTKRLTEELISLAKLAYNILSVSWLSV